MNRQEQIIAEGLRKTAKQSYWLGVVVGRAELLRSKRPVHLKGSPLCWTSFQFPY